MRLAQTVQDVGRLLVREVFWLEGFEKAGAELLVQIISRQEQPEKKRGNLSDISFILFAAFKKISGAVFRKFDFKIPIKGASEEIKTGIKNNEVIRLPRLAVLTNQQRLALLNTLLPLILKLGEKSLNILHENSFMRQDFGLELLRLAQLVLMHADSLLLLGSRDALAANIINKNNNNNHASLNNNNAKKEDQNPLQVETKKKNFDDLQNFLLKVVVGLYHILNSMSCFKEMKPEVVLPNKPATTNKAATNNDNLMQTEDPHLSSNKPEKRLSASTTSNKAPEEENKKEADDKDNKATSNK